MNHNEGVVFLFIALLACVVSFSIGLLFGDTGGISRCQKEAIKAGVAEWTLVSPDKTDVVFKWKVPNK